MRSFASYRWVLAVTVAAAVLAVFFYRPRAALAAGPDGNNAAGPTFQPCSKGERVGAPYRGTGEDCSTCVVSKTPSRPDPKPAADEGDDEAEEPQRSVTPEHGLNPGFNPDGTPMGTGNSPDGGSSTPGTPGAVYDPDYGCITVQIPIGIRGHYCGTPFADLNPDGANVVAMEPELNPPGDNVPPT